MTDRPAISDKPRLLLLITEDWYFWSHRLDLARAAREAGFEVCVATRVQEHGARIEQEGFRLVPIRLRRRGRNPLREFATILDLTRLYRREYPTVVHHVGMKPILYGSLAAWLAGVPAVVNAFAGLGYAFIADRPAVRIVRGLLGQVLRWALALSRSRVLVQNDADRDRLIEAGIVGPSRISVVRGAGVNLSVFAPAPEPAGAPVILLASRMLWDKGVAEFVEAIRLLKARRLALKGILVGRVDADNPACIPEAYLRSWQAEGVVEWWGYREDMPAVLASAHVVVLPSYREGLPKVLLEAAACARPVVATDVPGCRDVVRHGENGLLVPPRDALALAEAIEKLVLDRALRIRMGTSGRAMVEREFSAERLAREVVALYRELLAQSPILSPLSLSGRGLG